MRAYIRDSFACSKEDFVHTAPVIIILPRGILPLHVKELRLLFRAPAKMVVPPPQVSADGPLLEVPLLDWLGSIIDSFREPAR